MEYIIFLKQGYCFLLMPKIHATNYVCIKYACTWKARKNMKNGILKSQVLRLNEVTCFPGPMVTDTDTSVQRSSGTFIHICT